jgi:hypothetical protein
MLTLIKTADAVSLLNIYQTPDKKPGSKVLEKRQAAKKKLLATVYFTHELDPDKQNVSDAAGVLALHKEYLKKENHVSNYEFDEIVQLLDDEQEPDGHHPLKHAYWNIRQHFDQYLQREMFIGDDPGAMFELNIPTKRTDWPGTMTLIGSSGAGKTRFLTDMMLRYFRSTPDHSKRVLFWLSPELEIDKTIEPLKDKKWAMWFRGIDISAPALKKTGKDATSYFHENISNAIESSGENALIVLDDFPDGARALYPMLLQAYNNWIRVARHRNQGIFSLQHTYAGGKNTSQSLQSNKYIIFFPRSQQNRCITFLRDHLMMQINQARELVRRFAKLDRWLAIQMHSPVCLFNSSYLFLV